MKTTPAEKRAIEEIVKDLPPAEAARMRERLEQPDVIVWGKDDAMHRKIEEFYEARASRLRAEAARNGFTPGARTADNSWAPDKQEWLLINAFLNRLPESERNRAREIFLRTDARILANPGDVEGKALIEKVYEVRAHRIREIRKSLLK